jgi:hypothetical protein
VLLGTMDISAHAISLADRLNGPFGSPVFARTGKTDPPSRFIFSQTPAWKGLAYLVSRSLSDTNRLCGLRIDSGDRARLKVSTAR